MASSRNKFRAPSARAQWWDYSWSGAYFITMVTANRTHLFGDIVNGKMALSPTGLIVDVLWHDLPTHASTVELGDFIVMPNHIHGILVLNNPSNSSATTAAQNQERILPSQSRFQNQGANTISSIIGSYKSAVTKHTNRLGLENGWQPRFHDHLIRNDEEYQRISDYIVDNIKNWPGDKFYNNAT